MRASTLATFELVSTLPETRSPGFTDVSVTEIARICGAAFGVKRGTFLAIGGGVAARCAGAPGVGVTTGGVTSVGGGLGVGLGDGVLRATGLAEWDGGAWPFVVA